MGPSIVAKAVVAGHGSLKRERLPQEPLYSLLDELQVLPNYFTAEAKGRQRHYYEVYRPGDRNGGGT